MKTCPLSVILMVHNEEETIEKEVVSYYTEVTKKLPGSEIIIAEDGSTDNTRNILYALSKKIPLVLLVTPEKRGYGISLQLALKKAKGEVIMYADAGNKHDPKDIWKLYKEITHADVVTGYKKKRHDPWYRLVLARGLNTFVGIYFGHWFYDIDCGFKMMTKKTRDRLLKRPLTVKDLISCEVMLRASYCSLSIVQVPVTHMKRQFGASRGLPLKKIPKVVSTAIRNFPALKQDLIAYTSL